MTVPSLSVGLELDSPAADLAAFVASVRLCPASCWCDNEDVQLGRELVIEHSAMLVAGHPVGRSLTLSECGAVLAWLSVIQPKDPTVCYGHGGDRETVGHGVVLDWLRAQVLRHAG